MDIESALELGIKTGQSAASMARDLKQYLKEPDKLFRRVRDKDGKLHLSKAAQAYHPGQGVYRSSYKNALRLAVTEANMAYRASDYERVQNFDFVVGIEVRLSNNHTLNGKPFYDICDELKGKYPKDFKFRGWHPFCRCHAITILKTREELMADNERILDGQEPTEDSVNSVTELPDNFKAWAVKNKSRILAADEKGTLPYFITDNPYSVNSAIGQPLASVKVPLWYAHNAQVKEVQGKLKEIKQWSYDHPKSKKIVGLINDTDAAISNGAAIEDILARFEAANKEYKGKLWEAEYVAKKKAEAAKKPTALDIAKKRHEARTQQQIDQTKTEWTARRLNRLKDKIYDGLLPMESYDRITQLYVLLLKEHKFDEVNKGIATLQKAVARHKARTPEKIKAIKDAWNLRKEAILKDEQFLSALIPNVKDWKKQFSSKKLHEVYDAVEKKMQQINALPLDKQVAAINKEILYVSDATYLKPHTLYSTWEVSQTAYKAQLAIVENKLGISAIYDELEPINNWLKKHPKVKKLSGMVDEVEDLINSGADISAINAKMSAINTEYKNKLYEEQYAARLKARKATNAEAITFEELPKKRIDELLEQFAQNTVEGMDSELRPITEAVWATLTEEERRVVTKYTQTYSYLNETLREIRYLGSRTQAEYDRDMPLLTSVLNKFQTTKDMVVRRGTGNFHIAEIGKDLIDVKVGDIFTDKAFLSTACHRDKGFFESIEMVIVVPKGARGAFAEPFSHFTDNFRFSFDDEIWDGISVEEIRREFEWIGQRGCQFKVLKKQGSRIFLQLIGQLQ